MARGLALTTLLVVTPAYGQPAVAAEHLFDQGDALERAGKYAEACALFEQSYALDHATGAQLRLADCYEHIGRLAQAWQLFDAAQAQWTTTGDPRAAFARQRRDALVPRIALVELVLPEPLPPGIAVTIDGNAVPVIARHLRAAIDPGPRTLTVSAPGRAALAASLQLTVGATSTITVPALAPSIAPSTTMTTAIEVDRGHPRHRAIVAAAAIGVTSLAVAGGLSIAAYESYHSTVNSPSCIPGSPPHCTTAGQHAIAAAGTEADIATAFAAIGALAGGAAAWLYLTRPSDRVTIAPTVSATTVGLAVHGGF